MKALLFDFGGTLDSDGLTWKDRFFPLYREAGLDVPQERFDRAFYDSDDNLAKNHELDGLDLAETVALQVKDVLSNLGISSDGMAEAVSSRFTKECRSHFSRNKPLLERLAKKHKLGIVSNFYGNLSGILEREGLAPYFGAVADSAVVGAEKPAPRIFQYASCALGVETSDCLMIGDSVKRDMKGAEGMGMRHALLNPTEGPCCGAALRLKALPELEALLS